MAVRVAHPIGESLNARAVRLVTAMVAQANELKIRETRLPSGARVIDAGIDTLGGYAAGLALARVCMGGLGHLSYEHVTIGTDAYAGVQVWTDHPAIACMASQYAGWAIKTGNFFGMGSGPLRAHARVETELFDKLQYAEIATQGVLTVETRAHLTDDVATWVAERAKLPVAQLIFLVAPTASLAGGTQVVARVLETGLHKMDRLGFDVRQVISAMGTAPLAPTAKDDIHAIGRTNDCILYGGRTRFVVDAPDEALEDLAAKLPASASLDYGMPFSDIFKHYDNDFYKIDPLLFSPAEVWIVSAHSGRTFRGGQINPDVLKQSLFS